MTDSARTMAAVAEPDWPEPPDDWQPAAPTPSVSDRFPLLDWHALWEDEQSEEWIVEPVLPARRLVSIYSAPKLGKSLLMLELAVAVCNGTKVLGVTPDRARRVLYVDFENDPRGDIRSRLQAMQYGPDDLGNLCYLSFPTLAGLDSDEGGRDLLEVIAFHRCEVVVIDTISRAVSGEENENDTWLRFYRHTGLRLKQAGVTLVRLDHSGKDDTKGQRGGSAKSGDIDAVWRLSKVTDDTFRLDCEANRLPIVEKSLVLKRETEPVLRHYVEATGRAAAFDAKVQAVIEILDEASAPRDAGAHVARPLVRERGLRAGNDVIAEAVRKRRGQVPSADLSAGTADSTQTGDAA